MDIKRPKSKQPMPENAKRVFKGVIYDVYQWEQEMYDGTKAPFEKLKRPDTVVVFPVLPDGKILMTEQEQPMKGSFFSAPGGRMDEGEDVLTAAKRELLEETGYEAEEFILWNAEYPVGKIDWVVFVFVAKGLKQVSEMNPDSGEKIKLMPVTFEELLELPEKEDSFFADQEIVHKLLRARIYPDEMQKLKELFKPKEMVQ